MAMLAVALFMLLFSILSVLDAEAATVDYHKYIKLNNSVQLVKFELNKAEKDLKEELAEIPKLNILIKASCKNKNPLCLYYKKHLSGEYKDVKAVKARIALCKHKLHELTHKKKPVVKPTPTPSPVPTPFPEVDPTPVPVAQTPIPAALWLFVSPLMLLLARRKRG